MKRIDHFLRYYKRALKERGLFSSPINRAGFVEIESFFKQDDPTILRDLEGLVNFSAKCNKLDDINIDDVLIEYDLAHRHRMRLWAYVNLIKFLKEHDVYDAFSKNVISSKHVKTIRNYVMDLPFTVNPRKMIISAFLWGSGENPHGCDWSEIHRRWLKLVFDEYNKDI